MVALDDLSKFDTVVAQNLESAEAREALQRRIPVVLSDQIQVDNDGPLMTSAANPIGLARALGERAQERAPGSAVKIAVTVHGRQLMKGPLAHFPSPIGALHCRVEEGMAVAPHPSSLFAAAISTTGSDGPVTYGVIDDREFLAAVCLASAAFVDRTGRPGPAFELGGDYVTEAINAGLIVAARES